MRSRPAWASRRTAWRRANSSAAIICLAKISKARAQSAKSDKVSAAKYERPNLTYAPAIARGKARCARAHRPLAGKAVPPRSAEGRRSALLHQAPGKGYRRRGVGRIAGCADRAGERLVDRRAADEDAAVEAGAAQGFD